MMSLSIGLNQKSVAHCQRWSWRFVAQAIIETAEICQTQAGSQGAILRAFSLRAVLESAATDPPPG